MEVHSNHIQGDIILSPNTNPGENGPGKLFSDYLSSYSGGSITSYSNLAISNTEPEVLFNDSGSIKLNNTSLLSITNADGPVSLQGTNISINSLTVVNDTTDAISSSLSSLILKGGLYISKSIIIGGPLSALSGYHSLVNNNSIDGVLSVKNNNISGASSIDFYDNTSSIKLKIGYGNSLFSSPMGSISFIESMNSSALLFRSNSTDAFIINSDTTINVYNTNPSTSTSNASVVFLGGISINNTTESTSITSGGSISTGGGISALKSIRSGLGIYTSTFVDFTKILPIASPITDTLRLYTDSNDSLLKSKSSSGVVTVYQPINTKGDLVTHNGTTQVRFPVGVDGYTLISDSSTSSGLNWVESVPGTVGENNSINQIVFLGEVYISQEAVGAYINNISPLIPSGASCNILSSKSNVTTSGTITILNNNSSLITNGTFSFTFSPYSGLYINKIYTEATGQYELYSSDSLSSININLSGTVSVPVSTGMYGCGCISVSSISGPSGIIIYSKGYSILNTGTAAVMSSSAGVSGSKLQVSWPSSSSLSINKNSSGDNGVYNITDIFQLKFLHTTVVLSGTTPSIIQCFKFYQNKSLIVRVFSASDGYPCSVFVISKNSFLRIGNIMSISSPGATGETLILNWGVHQLLQISKSGINYDGTYNVQFSNL